MLPTDSERRHELLRRVATEIEGLRRKGVVRAAVDGVDGAGKTTLADKLADALAPSGRQVIRVSADDFLKPAEVRHRRGRHSPEGFFLDSYDYAALSRLVLEPLAPGGSMRVSRRAFDLRADHPVTAAQELAEPSAILLLDGLFLHRDELYRTWDYSLFLEVEFEVSLARCARRERSWASPDPTAPANRRYVGGQEIYLSQCNPRDRATHVIDNNDPHAPRLVR